MLEFERARQPNKFRSPSGLLGHAMRSLESYPAPRHGRTLCGGSGRGASRHSYDIEIKRGILPSLGRDVNLSVAERADTAHF